MCGITGAIWTDNRKSVSRHVLKNMTNVLEHRGPDGQGFHWEQPSGRPGVALGHQRLSVIDVAGGQQPLSNEDESVWVVFNGEIYNYEELRLSLESAGHRFRTRSDTETIVHLYEEKGLDFLQSLRGMFALAIWDSHQSRLLLARDRLGQKPLVYHESAGRLLFASEIKSILQVPDVSRDIDSAALDQYLTYLYVPHPRTMFRGISKLPPASFAVYERGRLDIKRYWSPDFNSRLSISLEESQERLAVELREAVRLRMRSDVPLGAFLSGGIDSTVIVGLMQAISNKPVKTYTASFAIDEFDESSEAREVAKALQTDHHEFCLQADSLETLPQIIYHYDEPFGDSSAIPTYYLSQVTSHNVKVALTGDGGDELFGGYPRYQTVEKFSWLDGLPTFVRALLGNRLWDWLPAPHQQNSLLRKFRQRMSMMRQASEYRFANWITHFNPTQRKAIYAAGFVEQVESLDAESFFVEAIKKCRSRGGGSRAMLADLQTYLPCDLLVKVDIASMAHGLECRSPFLDHRVVELAAALPYSQKIVGADHKHILKTTFRDIIPPRIANRKKTGFNLPLAHWFRGPYQEFLREHLLDPASINRGYFKAEVVDQLIREHVSGSWDHHRQLWALLCLELWHRTFIDPTTMISSTVDRGVT